MKCAIFKKLIASVGFLALGAGLTFAQDEGLGLTVGAKFNFDDVAADPNDYNTFQFVPYATFSKTFIEHLSLDVGLYLNLNIASDDYYPVDGGDPTSVAFGLYDSGGSLYNFGFFGFPRTGGDNGFQVTIGWTQPGVGPGVLGIFLRNRLGALISPKEDYEDRFAIGDDLRPEIKYTIPVAGSLAFDLNYTIPLAIRGFPTEDYKPAHTLEFDVNWASEMGLGIEAWVDFNIPTDSDKVGEDHGYAEGFYVPSFALLPSYGFDAGPGKLTLSLEADFNFGWMGEDGGKFENITLIPKVEYALSGGVPLGFYVKATVGNIGQNEDDFGEADVSFTPELGISYSF